MSIKNSILKLFSSKKEECCPLPLQLTSPVQDSRLRCTVSIKTLNKHVKLPQKANPEDSGYDLSVAWYKDEGSFITVGTGISAKPQIGFYLEVFARSSLHKKNLMLFNSVGIIDNSYTGEIMLKLYKTDPSAKVEIGDRIAQFIPKQYALVEIIQVSVIEETDRGDGGFGSSGVQ